MISHTFRLALSYVLSAILIVTSQIPLTSTQAANETLQKPRLDKLRKHDRARLSEARVQGKREVTLLIASTLGANDAVAREIASIHGAIRYRADDISYLRATVPIGSVETITRSRNVQLVNLEGYPDYYSSGPLEGSFEIELQAQENNSVSSGPPPNYDTPAENPYLPTQDIGAPQFVKAHPTFDGRGVTIAVVEDFLDWLAPELQTATTLDGKTTPKIVEIHNDVDATDEGDDKRVEMKNEVTARGGHFEFSNKTYSVPSNGSYRVGMFDATPREGTDAFFPYRRFSYFDKINFAGNPRGRGFLFTVLWSEKTNTVWVDTNQNYDFTDDKPMTDYNIRRDIGAFGRDDPSTPIRDSAPFVIFTDPDNNTVTLGIGTNSHTNGVASAAAGKAFFGGKMNGSAPEAQLVIYRGNLLKNYSPIEAVIHAAQNPRVDLITMSWGLVMRLNDGNAVLDVVFDRLIERYRKPIFIGASNGGPAMNTAFDTTTKVVIVGGYISRDTWRANFGLSSERADYIANTASRGPREDGAMKPDVVAPYDSMLSASALSPGYAWGQAYKLPPGYQQSGGTSYSGPMVAGGAALLISAAKQARVTYDAERISWAIKVGARFLPGSGAHEQGAGLMNVGAAWEALNRGPAPVDIRSTAPVKTILSRYLKEPNRGPGIYEREGWTAGQSGQREITFTRTSGSTKTLSYGLKWTGNDSTFISGRTISLPLNTPMRLPITINPKTSGVHSALLSLIDQQTSYPIYQTMNTIIAGEQFTPDNKYTITHPGRADFLSWKSYFVNVPAGSSAFKVDLMVSNGNVKLNFFDPSGTSYFTSHPRTPGKGLVQYQEGGTWSRAIPNPEPGVWEVIIINENTNKVGVRLKPQPPATFTFNASVFRVNVQSELTAAMKEVTASWKVDFTNASTPFKGGVAETPLGSAFSDRAELRSNGQPKIYDIEVLPGTTTLTVRIGSSSDHTADLDLYLYDCTGGAACFAVEHSVGGGAEEIVTINNPRAGKWRALIDPFNIPAGRTTCEYLDVFTNPVFGSLSAGSNTVRDCGARWREEISIRVGKWPSLPRSQMIVLNIQSETANSVTYRISEPPDIKAVALGTAWFEKYLKRK